MEFDWKDFLQFAVVIPVMLIWRQLTMHQKSHEELKANAVTKEEMEKFVKLSQEPLEVKLEFIQKDIASVQGDTKDIKDLKSTGAGIVARRTLISPHTHSTS